MMMRAITLGLLAGGGWLLASCSANEADLSGEDGAHLVMAWDASREPASLDGHIEPYQPAWLIDSLIADPLLVLGPDGDYHPALATSWTSSPEADAWTFELRDDVTFQDGTVFDAEAVKYNIERVLSPETQSAEMAAQIGPVERIEIVNAHTVTLHYRVPWVTVLDAFRRVPFWSPAAAEKWGVKEFDRHLVGAGPFTLREWVPNSHVVLERWEGYGGWNAISERPGPALLDKVTIRFIGEEAVRLRGDLHGQPDHRGHPQRRTPLREPRLPLRASRRNGVHPRRRQARRDPALRVPGQPDRLPRAADPDAEGRLAGHAQGARPGAREGRALPAGVDVRVLR